MNKEIEQLQAKLEDVDYAMVYQIWDTYCNQEPPKQGQLISEIIELVEEDEDVFEIVKNITLDPQANGFENIPAECENWECNECQADHEIRRRIDCPYLKVR